MNEGHELASVIVVDAREKLQPIEAVQSDSICIDEISSLQISNLIQLFRSHIMPSPLRWLKRSAGTDNLLSSPRKRAEEWSKPALA